ncbi:MAG: hypothetical protein HY907_06000 [Deltaproteobacteria bacterium]|nr:hypothetical protein [Deltaproteobacteria bacterium]
MKEDILEQLVEDWYVARTGWFVKHNVKFRPDPAHPDYDRRRDSVHSDIDILAVSAIAKGTGRVEVVTCKSWQGGFDLRHWKKVLEGEATYSERGAKFKPREPWKGFHELVSTKWIEAFVRQIERETGQRNLVYRIAATRLLGGDSDRKALEGSTIIRDRFRRCDSAIDLRIVTLNEILSEYFTRIRQKKTPTPEATEVGRLLQLVAAAGFRLDSQPFDDAAADVEPPD